MKRVYHRNRRMEGTKNGKGGNSRPKKERKSEKILSEERLTSKVNKSNKFIGKLQIE